MKKVNTRVVMIQLSIYFFLAGFGYASMLNNTPPVIILREPPQAFTSDSLMLIGRCMMVVILLIAVVTLTLPFRHELRNMLNRFAKIPRTSNTWHFSSTTIMVFMTMSLSIVFSDLEIILNMLGSACTLIAFLFPALVEVVNSNQPWYSFKNIFYLFTGFFLTLLGSISVVITSLQSLETN